MKRSEMQGPVDPHVAGAHAGCDADTALSVSAGNLATLLRGIMFAGMISGRDLSPPRALVRGPVELIQYLPAPQRHPRA